VTRPSRLAFYPDRNTAPHSAGSHRFIPHAAAHAGRVCKRLKSRIPELRVMVALWTSESSDKFQTRLRDAGADQVVTRLPEAIAKLRELQQYKPQAQTALSRQR
jgi:hypothetical protein